jgi:hypothetical protein
MDIIQRFLSGITVEPFKNLLDLMSLAPERLWSSLVLLAAFMLLNDLIRTALMVEYTRSVLNHVIVSVLTIFPGVVLGFVLLYGGYRHPGRVWINLGLASALYVAWYIGGTLTRLSRRDTEGSDIGWMSHGYIITLFCGLLAVVLF